MASAPATKWWLEADYLQACNCDYGCPCEFEAPPTEGFCEGLGAWRISKGKFGDVSLDGLGFGGVLKFPGAMHKGNGTMAWLIDSNANPEQRKALETIVSGAAGGMPFEVFPMLLSNKPAPRYLPFNFKLDGRNSSVTIGDALSVQFEPIKNPVTGDPEEIRVEHGTGFMFKGADCVSTKESRFNFDGWSFSQPNKAGFVTKVKYGN
jgi:hypothetical protein